MTEEKKQIAVAVLVIWLLLVLFFMILGRSLSLEMFLVLWLIGLLVIVELIGPSFVRPSYIRYLTDLVDEDGDDCSCKGERDGECDRECDEDGVLTHYFSEKPAH